MVSMWNLKIRLQTNLFYETEVESWLYKTNLRLPGDKCGEELIERFGLTRHTTIYKTDN